MEKIKEIQLPPQHHLLRKTLRFSKAFRHVSIFHSNNYPDVYGRFEFMAALGGYRLFQTQENPFKALKQYFEERPSWLFGHLSYDLKNQIEDLRSTHSKQFGFKDISFFEPAYLLLQKRNSTILELYVNFDVDPEPILAFAESFYEKEKAEESQIFPKMKAQLSREEYLSSLRELKAEIQYGNIYEVNYCQEFYAEGVEVSPQQLFNQLNQKSPMPFGGFYQWEEDFLLCASPERYLCKRGDELISQPIKGTAKRGRTTAEDFAIKQGLQDDLKEQTENVMIVDLVRNDLSRTAARSSVKVEELFGTYTFPQVHQLISTVSSKLRKDLHFTDAIKASFPMGSMTGAPKISAMKLIDQHEKSRRELYSGSIGYITPYGDFDFNVVIRSLLYNQQKQYLSLTVGGAITDRSIPENEYQECLLKAKAIFDQQKPE